MGSKFIHTGLNGNVYYGDSRIVGFERDGRVWSVEEIANMHVRYERALRRGRFDKVRELEKKDGAPYTWLNLVLHNLIKDVNLGVGRLLIEEFSDRGFRESSLNGKYKRQGGDF